MEAHGRQKGGGRENNGVGWGWVDCIIIVIVLIIIIIIVSFVEVTKNGTMKGSKEGVDRPLLISQQTSLLS